MTLNYNRRAHDDEEVILWWDGEYKTFRIIAFIMKDDLGLPNTLSQSHIL